ncbi:hypothetical protein GGR56DRAFT_690885 [Xylariaceae sp. FL0804]|nr:hypothetical protein GGR56DRAFT_690885 [Xylariaceae sp. FL0804]
MPRPKPNYDFDIHVDPSCLSAAMSEETPRPVSDEHEIEPANGESEESQVLPSIEDQHPPYEDESTHEDELGDDSDACGPADTSELDQESSFVETEGDHSVLDSDAEADYSQEHDQELTLQPNIEGEKLEREDTAEEEQSSHKDASAPSRRASGRTEALIQAAARDIMAQIEHHQDATREADGGGGADDSLLSEDTQNSLDLDSAEPSYIEQSGLEDHNNGPLEPNDSDETPKVDFNGDSSSQHEATDEDVFSDKSLRSSLGSYDGGSESGKTQAEVDRMTTVTTTRSPRISDISQYDKEGDDFVPTARPTPRLPFRTPSDVRALQMSSPTPSVVASPPRSAKRHHHHHFPTVSRLGTPTASAHHHHLQQYSPKGRTPSRFKPRPQQDAAPLVLLHATLLPLRWAWGDVLDGLDGANGAAAEVVSEPLRALREAWLLLRDRVDDTVAERGLLLGHPQDDYEVLEERLLEALELPARRRARILECGHYLGPANEASLLLGGEDELLSEDDSAASSTSLSRRQSSHSQNNPRDERRRHHWCATCRSEIRYDALGADRVFRVKVYASNGLMRAGAWAACWREMERVDVELEPLVEPAAHDELVRLAAAAAQRQRDLDQRRRQEEEADEEDEEEAEIAREVALQFEEHKACDEAAGLLHAQVDVLPPPPPSSSSSPMTSRPGREEEGQEEEEPTFADFETAAERDPEPEPEPARAPRSRGRRQQREEERLREIYGHTSPPPPPDSVESPSSSTRHRGPSPYDPSQPPSSPARTHGHRSAAYQSASLPELLAEAARVLARDRRNLAIAALSLVVLVLALRAAAAGGAAPPTNGLHIPAYGYGYEPKPAPEMVVQQRGEATTTHMVRQTPEEMEAAAVVMESVVPTLLLNDSAAEEEMMMSSHAAAAGVSTVYEPCETPVAAASQQPQQQNLLPAGEEMAEKEPQIEPEIEIETETQIQTVTRKKVVRVVQTVTETDVQTETAVETVRAPATSAAVARPPPPAVEPGPELVGKKMAVEAPNEVGGGAAVDDGAAPAAEVELGDEAAGEAAIETQEEDVVIEAV